MAITYDPVTNTITVTGYTLAVPCTFIDLENADKAGTMSLIDRDGITAVDGAPVAVTRALRPADYIVLGGSSGDLYITVTNWTNMTTATIRITGTDRDGNAQTEDIVVNANGTFNTAKWFKTVTHTQVIVFTKSDSGSFDYELIQGQWGVVWGLLGQSFFLDCRLKIGDGVIETFFADEKKLIQFKWWSTGPAIELTNNAHFRLGKVLNAADRSTTDGCAVLLPSIFSSPYNLLECLSGHGDVEFYGSCFFGDVRNLNSQIQVDDGNHKIWNSQFLYFRIRRISTSVQKDDFYRLSFSNTGINAVLMHPYPVYFNDVIILDCHEGFLIPCCENYTLKNLKLINETTSFRVVGEPAGAPGSVICVNSECKWIFFWTGPPFLIFPVVWRKYEFDLKLTDKNENAIPGATVKIRDLNDNLVVDTTTNASGVIATQTLNYGYYVRAGGNTPTMQTPHTIQISKAGYETYKKKWTIDEKTDWIIALYTPKRRFDSLEG